MKTSTPKPGETADPARNPTLYTLISQVLRKAIVEGSIEEGAVILEGPVADILQATRTPVRQALRELEEEGLVSRFDGRGYLAGPAGVEPRRIALTPDMLGVADGAGPVRKTLGWEAIYDEVEREVVHLSVFEQQRINELELARHYGVGRMVARDVLLRLESLGLLEKDERQRWTLRPLDARRIHDLYELRWLLEPVALRGAVASTPAPDIDDAAGRLRKAIKAYPRVSRTAMDALEHDLHVELLAHCPNRDLLHSLERTRCLLTLSKHALGTSMPMPRSDPFMSEHLAILEAAGRGDIEGSQALLRGHLEDSCVKLVARVATLRGVYARPNLPYLAER